MCFSEGFGGRVGSGTYVPPFLQKSSDSAQRWVPVNDVGIAEPPPKMGQDYRGPIGDNFKDRPFLERLNFLHIGLLTITPLLGLYGVCTATWDWRTCAFAVFYYVFSGLGITAGARWAVMRLGYITSLPDSCTWPAQATIATLRTSATRPHSCCTCFCCSWAQPLLRGAHAGGRATTALTTSTSTRRRTPTPRRRASSSRTVAGCSRSRTPPRSAAPTSAVRGRAVRVALGSPALTRSLAARRPQR